MAAVIIRLRVFLVDTRFGGERYVAAFPRDRLSDVVARVLAEVGIEDNPKKWDLLNDDAVLPPERTVGELIAISPPTNGLLLRKLSSSDSGTSLSSIFGNTFDIPLTNDASQSGSLAISVTDSDKLNPPVVGDVSNPVESSPLRDNFTDILLKKKIISLEQLEESERIAGSQGVKIQVALTKLNYATEAQCLAAIAEKKRLALIDLTDVTVPKAIIELVPESVARENTVLPLSLEGNTLRVATANPDDYDTVQKLEFILNKIIVPVLATRAQILEAINRHYGESETESVDSMLVEFTDTAIEFTQTETKPEVAPGAPSAPELHSRNTPPAPAPGELVETNFDAPPLKSEPPPASEGSSDAAVPPRDETPPPAPVSTPQPAPMRPGAARSAPPRSSGPPLGGVRPSRSTPSRSMPVDDDDWDEDEDSGAAPALKPRSGGFAAAKSKKAESGAFAQPITTGKAKSTTERRATVRYYSRMNPDRVVPLLVMLTRHEVEEVIKQYVEQKATGPLTISKDVPVEIEPVLPGCQCHPPKITTLLGASDDVFTFHIVPHVLGEVTGARVLIRQDHKMLAEIALDMRVVQRTLVVASGLSTFVVPAASAAMKHFGLDFTPKGGGNPYLAALNFLFGEVPPVLLTAVLAVVTVALYFYTRPKGRDVFFDISTKPTPAK